MSCDGARIAAARPCGRDALKPQGNRLVGTGQGQESKTPVSVDLVRTGSGDTFSFEGTLKYGDRIFKASSGDVTDMSAKEFQEQTAIDETIIENPADFHEVTPGTIAFRVNRPVLDRFSEIAACRECEGAGLHALHRAAESLRRGYFDVQAEVDPERALEIIAKARSLPRRDARGLDQWRHRSQPLGPLSAAASWRDANGKLDREKLGKAVAAVTAKALSAENRR